MKADEYLVVVVPSMYLLYRYLRRRARIHMRYIFDAGGSKLPACPFNSRKFIERVRLLFFARSARGCSAGTRHGGRSSDCVCVRMEEEQLSDVDQE